MLRLEQSNTYYEPLYCDKCGGVTDAGEAITVNRAETILTDNGFTALKHYLDLCPNCYVEELKKNVNR